MALTEMGKKGMFDVDTYLLKIQGLVDVDLHMRVAQPVLQTENEAYAHFNLHFSELEVRDCALFPLIQPLICGIEVSHLVCDPRLSLA